MPDYIGRLEKLRTIMRIHGIDVVALVPGPNLRYLTGGVHFLMERPIVMFIPLDDQPVAVIPKLEVPLFEAHNIPSRIISWTDAEGYENAFKSGLDTLRIAGKVMGAEGLRMRFIEGEIIRQYAPTTTLIPIDQPLSELRLIKELDEIAAIEQAIHISEQALTLTLADIQMGMSERAIAAILERYLQELGSEGLAFTTIMHGGGNTALPHCGPLDYQVQAGDPLIFDFGATYQGYCADITRVVFLGQPSQSFQDFYAVVRTANARALAAAKPGITAGSLDSCTRQVFADFGWDHLIRHRTGHGLGLEAHEAPYIVQTNQQVLRAGMVFTIEPGIYQMGQIGVRIEDDVLITDDGARSLTTWNRDLVVIG